jgi:hypothetical protein
VDFGDYDKEYLASTNDEELIEKPNQHYTNWIECRVILWAYV